MENLKIDAAGKEHRPESSPFLTNERDNIIRPCSRNKDFLEKSYKLQDTRRKTQEEEKSQDFVPMHRFPRESDLSDSSDPSDKFAGIAHDSRHHPFI